MFHFAEAVSTNEMQRNKVATGIAHQQDGLEAEDLLDHSNVLDGGVELVPAHVAKGQELRQLKIERRAAARAQRSSLKGRSTGATIC